MKKFLVLFFSIFICSIAHADTETINWYVDGNSYATTTCQTGDDIILPNTPYKYGYTFQGWSIFYTQIEYLESTGTQWIDTGYMPNQNTGVKAKFKINSFVDQISIFFGIDNGDIEFRSIAYNGKYFFFYGTQMNDNLNASISDIIEFDWNKNLIRFNKNNSTAVITFNPETFSLPVTMWIFSQNDGIGSNRYGHTKVKLYFFQIYDNGTLVRDFIPVLDNNNVPCMYDKVTNQFFYNQGTGNFIAGPVINQ